MSNLFIKRIVKTKTELGKRYDIPRAYGVIFYDVETPAVYTCILPFNLIVRWGYRIWQYVKYGKTTKGNCFK